MGEYAWVTLATNDTYSLGALVLAHSLKSSGTKHELAVLVTPGVTMPMRENLASVYNVVHEVNVLDSKDEANLRLLKRPELGITFTKLHCWRLTQYKKCVFLDADTMVLQNSDELFERDEFSAAPDVGWPDCFNSGVFVYCPSNETYDKLIKFALENGSFDGGDQGLLNLYFSDWAHKDINKHLPFIYNMCSTAAYSYLPAYKQFGVNAKIVHFIGNTKPWMQHFDLKSKCVQSTPELQHLHTVLQKWWNLFCMFIHPQLSREMAQNITAQHIARQSPSVNDALDICLVNKEIEYLDNANASVDLHFTKFLDPWEEYDERCVKALDNSYVVELCDPPLKDDRNSVRTLAQTNITVDESNNRITHSISDSFYAPQSVDPSAHVAFTTHHKEPSCPIATAAQPLSSTFTNFQHHQPTSTGNSGPAPPATETNILNEQSDPTLCVASEISTLTKWNINEISLTKAPETVFMHKEVETNPPDADAGLAGLFAQCTLGADGQSALEDHIHRQSWEVGNIDYLGRDSFENIWDKICRTMGEAPAKKETTPVTAPEQQETEVKKVSLPESPKEDERVEITEQSVVEEVAPAPVTSEDQIASVTESPPQAVELTDTATSVAEAVPESCAPPAIPSPTPALLEAVVTPTTVTPVTSTPEVPIAETPVADVQTAAIPIAPVPEALISTPTQDVVPEKAAEPSITETPVASTPEVPLATTPVVDVLQTTPTPVTPAPILDIIEALTPALEASVEPVPTPPTLESSAKEAATTIAPEEKCVAATVQEASEPEVLSKASTESIPRPAIVEGTVVKEPMTKIESPVTVAKESEMPGAAGTESSETKEATAAPEELKKAESSTSEVEAKKETKRPSAKKQDAPTPPPRKSSGESKKKGKK